MTTDTPNTCQKCGKPILEGSPRGLCALCLISAVAKSDEPLPTDAPSPEMDDLRTAFPQFEILEPLGAGGMGRVYKVRQPNLDRIVALKLLPPAYAADPEWIERFTREARALARLNHPNIVQVYDFGETAPGENGERFPFLLMEYVDGVNLRQALRTGALTAREALTIVPSVCAALQYAHDQGVLHRDIKPENILLDTLGRVKIADFGLAKLRNESSPGLTLTATGAHLGTAAYMAPEQIEKPHDVDHRADIYSLGVVFYELLTGGLPLGRFLSPSEKSGTDPRLDTIVFRTLEKERDRRFQSATDMRTEVENVANHPAPEPAPAPAVSAKIPELPRPRLAKVAVTGASLVALGLPFIVGAAIVVGLIVPHTTASHNQFGVRPTWGLTMLPVLAGLFGMLPAIAGTVCGWVGVAKIRASAGALRGAGLATFAALFYPALFLFALCTLLLGRLFSGGAVVVGMFLGIGLAAWAGRALWNFAGGPAQVAGPRPLPWPWLAGFALLAGVIALPVLGLVLPYFAMRTPPALLGRSPAADVVTAERAPFVGQLPEGSVELVAVSRHPSTGEPWWKMDGSPANAGPFLNKGATASAGAGERGFEFVFHIKNLPPGAHLTTWQVENSQGWASGSAPELASAPGQRLADHKVLAATLPATLRATDIRIGFGFGEWETVFDSGTSGPGGTSPTHRGVNWKLGWSAPLETKDGDLVTNWNGPRDPDWETRVVAVKNDGSIVTTDNRSSANDQTTWIFPKLPVAELKTFHFQVRRVQWIEFRGIKLAPSKATARAEVKQAPLSREDQFIFNARQHLNNAGVDSLAVAAAQHGLAVAEARGDAVKIAKANLTLARTQLSHERLRRERGSLPDMDLVEGERVVKEAEQELEAARAKATAALEKADAPKP